MINKIYFAVSLFMVTLQVHHLKAASFANEINGKLAQGPGEEIDKDLQCGGVHKVLDELSVLTYRFNQPTVSPQESCVWTLHAVNRSIIKINVTDHTNMYSSSYQFIAVGYFNNSNFDSINSFTWIKLPISFVPQAIEVPGPVAFVHWSYVVSLSMRPSFGFRLTFEANGEEQNSIYNFENYFLGGQYGRFKYPPNGGSYENNQRVTIVVKQISGFPVLGHPTPSHIYIKNNGIESSEDCLRDNINVYSFGEESQTWYRNDSRCGPEGGISGYFFYYPRNDPMIFTFKSDENGVGSGFELFWLNYEF